jgi:hypothetical protein
MYDFGVQSQLLDVEFAADREWRAFSPIAMQSTKVTGLLLRAQQFYLILIYTKSTLQLSEFNVVSENVLS